MKALEKVKTPGPFLWPPFPSCRSHPTAPESPQRTSNMQIVPMHPGESLTFCQYFCQLPWTNCPVGMQNTFMATSTVKFQFIYNKHNLTSASARWINTSSLCCCSLGRERTAQLCSRVTQPTQRKLRFSWYLNLHYSENFIFRFRKA